MLKYPEPIRYGKLLSQRKHPLVDPIALEEWFAKLTRVRRNKLRLLHFRQNCKCFYCGIDMFIKRVIGRPKELYATLDHLIPVSEGGSDHLDNLAACCSRCNAHRGTRPVEEFKQLVADGYYERLGTMRNDRALAREQRKADNPKKQQNVREFQFYLALVMLAVPETQKLVDSFLAQRASEIAIKQKVPIRVPAAKPKDQHSTRKRRTRSRRKTGMQSIAS